MSHPFKPWPVRPKVVYLLITLLLALLPVPTQGQEPVSDDFFKGLRWQNIGPNRGGRSIGAAGSTARPLEYFFGAAGGGLWKTTDGGLNWRAVTDGSERRSFLFGFFMSLVQATKRRRT